MSTLHGASLEEENKTAWDQLYASTRELVWGAEPVAFLPRFLPIERDLPGGEVLDAAAGEGRNLPLLLRLGRPVTACDSSPSALSKIPPAFAGRVAPLVCELSAVPLPSERFAFILLSDTVETLPEPGPVLAELRRLLVPGGLLLANVPGPEDGIAGRDMAPAAGDGWLYRGRYFYRFYEQAEAEGLFARAGLEAAGCGDWSWGEPAHPHFRDAPHEHRSRIFLLRRPR